VSLAREEGVTQFVVSITAMAPTEGLACVFLGEGFFLLKKKLSSWQLRACTIASTAVIAVITSPVWKCSIQIALMVLSCLQ
jgi:hypothetical protein